MQEYVQSHNENIHPYPQPELYLPVRTSPSHWNLHGKDIPRDFAHPISILAIPASIDGYHCSLLDRHYPSLHDLAHRKKLYMIILQDISDGIIEMGECTGIVYGIFFYDESANFQSSMCLSSKHIMPLIFIVEVWNLLGQEMIETISFDENMQVIFVVSIHG